MLELVLRFFFDSEVMDINIPFAINIFTGQTKILETSNKLLQRAIDNLMSNNFNLLRRQNRDLYYGVKDYRDSEYKE